MKKRVVMVSIMVLVGLVLLGSAFQVSAQAMRIDDLTSYEYDCAILETLNPTFTGKDGKIMQIRDYVHVNINISDSPYLAGINTTVANAEINTETGHASIRGTMSLEPSAYPGSSWEGHWVFLASNGANFGWSVARGTGELKGMTLFMNLFDAPQADDAVEKCAAVSYDGYTGVPEETFTNTEAYILVSGR